MYEVHESSITGNRIPAFTPSTMLKIHLMTSVTAVGALRQVHIHKAAKTNVILVVLIWLKFGTLE